MGFIREYTPHNSQKDLLEHHMEVKFTCNHNVWFLPSISAIHSLMGSIQFRSENSQSQVYQFSGQKSVHGWAQIISYKNITLRKY